MGAERVRAIATYHPAAIKRDEARYSEVFLRDVAKAVQFSRGEGGDVPPEILKNPQPKVLQQLHQRAQQVAVDIETPGLKTNRILSVAIAFNAQEVVAIDLESAPHAVKQEVGRILSDPKVMKVVQNGAFDLPILDRCGYPTSGKVVDTMIAGHILDPDGLTNLSHLVSLYLDVEPWKFMRGGDLLHYNALDAAYTFRLWLALRKALQGRSQLSFFLNHVMPLLVEVIIPLNGVGIRVDPAEVLRLNTEWGDKIASWNARVAIHFEGLSVNRDEPLLPPIGKRGSLSSKQMQTLCYEVLGLPTQLNPKNRRPTTDRAALLRLESVDPSGTISILLERSKLKEYETHIKIKPDRGGRVRSRYVLGGDEKHREFTEKGAGRAKDKGPATGRLASREPNLQNFPKECRKIFVPTYPDWWFVEGDSSQIEARLTQHFSKDPALKEAIDEGVYLYTCFLIDRVSGLYGVSQGGWSDLQSRYRDREPLVVNGRDESKRSFLGWSYRMGPKKLELTTGIPFARAKTILQLLDSLFVGVVRFWEDTIASANVQGYLENPFGRRRYFRSPSTQVPEICNFLAQGTAADILFKSMRTIKAQMPTDGTSLINTIHDANLLEGPNRDVMATLLRNAMAAPIPELGGLVIPVRVKAGKNWGSLHEL